MNPSVKRIATYFIKLLVSAGAIYYIITNVPFDQLGEVLRGTDKGLFVVALITYLASQAVSTVRLNELLAARYINLPFLTNFKLYLVGMSYNLFLPGGVGGDGYKIIWISKQYLKSKRKIFTSVLLDRLSGLLAILLFLCLVVPLKYTPGYLYFLPLLLFPIIVVSGYYLLRLIFPKYRIVYLSSITWSAIIQILQILCVITLAYAVHSSVDLTTLIFIFLISSVATAVPVFLGGLGARELVFGLMANELGVNPEYAVSIALLFSLITVIWSIPGLVIDWKMKIR